MLFKGATSAEKRQLVNISPVAAAPSLSRQLFHRVPGRPAVCLSLFVVFFGFPNESLVGAKQMYHYWIFPGVLTKWKRPFLAQKIAAKMAPAYMETKAKTSVSPSCILSHSILVGRPVPTWPCGGL